MNKKMLKIYFQLIQTLFMNCGSLKVSVYNVKAAIIFVQASFISCFFKNML